MDILVQVVSNRSSAFSDGNSRDECRYLHVSKKRGEEKPGLFVEGGD